MNPVLRRPIIRIAVLMGAWCCGFLIYFILGKSLGKTWTECSLGEWLIDIWQDYSKTLEARLKIMTLSKESYGQIVALTLGNREYLSPETKSLYREAGASHILALSGMHLGIIYGMFRIVMQNLAFTRWKWLAGGCMLALIWFYALMTGCPKSLIRAALMTSIALGLQMHGGKRKSIDILNLSAAIVLLVDPASIMDIGFQLSCAAMLGLIILGLPTLEYFYKMPFPIKFLSSSLAISFSAQLATMPLTMLYFHNVALYGAITSLVAVPLTTAIIYTSLGLFLGIDWCVPLAEWLIRIQNTVMLYISQLPGAYIEL